jgi:hypothetical protein
MFTWPGIDTAQNYKDEENGDEMLELLATESKALLADIKDSASNVKEICINPWWAYYRYPKGTANAYVAPLALMATRVFDRLSTDLWDSTMSRKLAELR